MEKIWIRHVKLILEVKKISIKLSLNESCTNVPALATSGALHCPFQILSQAEISVAFIIALDHSDPLVYEINTFEFFAVGAK